MPQQEQAIPTLRFPEFNKPWEKCLLQDGIELISGQHLNPDEYSNLEGETPYFTGPSDFTNDNAAITKWSLRSSKMAYQDDVLITVKGNGVGELWYLNLKNVAIGRQLMALRSKGYSTNLIFHYLSMLKDYYFALASGNMIPGLTRDDILKTKLFVPNIVEQQKIAAFLGEVDEKIVQLQKKKDLLEDYKKGCMQKLFSQELRFTDDNGKPFPDWEDIKFGDIASFKKGKGISKADIKEDGVNKCIRYGELYTEYNAFISNVKSYTDTPLQGSVLSKANDMLMPTSDVTPTGLATASALDEEGVILGGDILIIRSKQLSNRYFSYYVSAHKNQIMRLVTGVTVYHIYGSDLATLRLNLPSMNEQKKIAYFLSAIDDKIALVAEKLDKAKTFKKGLLQQMFV